MRRDSRNDVSVNIPTLSGYHYGNYESLKCFNSDRPVLLDNNFAVSNENTDSIKRICKVGSHLGMFGLEVETENHNVSDSTIAVNLLVMVFDKLFPTDMWKCERDGSLSGNGSVECISQCFTKAFMRNNYKNFKAMFDNYFTAFGITTENDNCGMHVSVDLTNLGKNTEDQKENAKKLYYLINKHFELFTVAFSRTNGTYWCGRCRDWQRIKDVNFDDHEWSASHNFCMNYSHASTGRLEIRLVGGQKNYACFRNTMETVFHVVDAVKKLSWSDLDDITKVFKGCNNHVYDRLTRCKREGVLNQVDLDKIATTVKPVDWA